QGRVLGRGQHRARGEGREQARGGEPGGRGFPGAEQVPGELRVEHVDQRLDQAERTGCGGPATGIAARRSHRPWVTVVHIFMVTTDGSSVVFCLACYQINCLSGIAEAGMRSGAALGALAVALAATAWPRAADPALIDTFWHAATACDHEVWLGGDGR